MMQGVQDLFDLFASGFKDNKFVQGVKRSFVSTGCVPIYDDALNFLEYTKNKICGTLQIVPTGSYNVIDLTNIDSPDIVFDERNELTEIIDNMTEYDNAMLEATDVMDFILNL